MTPTEALAAALWNATGDPGLPVGRAATIYTGKAARILAALPDGWHLTNALPLYLALEEAASTLLSGEPFDYHRADAAWNDLRAALAALDAWKRGEK